MGDKKIDIWKEEEKIKERKTYIKACNKAYEEVDNFFEGLYAKENTATTDTKYTGLLYSESQNSYALDIMGAIKEKQILLIQAGVGIGKSFGYLIPIFYTYQNVETFHKVMISTSSIALQQQLLQDIKRISKMLEINIKAEIAKGVNNYACIKKIENLLMKNSISPEKKQIIEDLNQTIGKLGSCDKEDLREFSEKIWQEVQLQSRGYCSNCAFIKRCPFYKKQQEIKTSNIIITNHANLIKNALDEEEGIQDVDMYVFDEAHQLESYMQTLKKQDFYLRNIEKVIDQVRMTISLNFSNQKITSIEEEKIDYIYKLKRDIEKLFSAIRRSSSINFSNNNKNNHSIVDCDRLGFQYNKSIIYLLKDILNGFSLFFQEIFQYEVQNNIKIQTRELEQLKEIYALFKDMANLEDSKNIYWADFFRKNLINLCCIPKENTEVATKIFKAKVPIILTSGTMLASENNYQYFREGIAIDKIEPARKISFGESYLSPYDYQNHTLCYYDPNITIPNQYQEYLWDLSFKIDELIRITKGKTLILFTSKKCMNDVYKLLSNNHYEFNLYLHTDTNTNEIKDIFTKDINSCLFATGSFWEGIDIKGKSLSHLIITHLPFDVVDVVTQFKASKYKNKKDQFQEVYIPSMLIKLEQAMGRLIRSNTDTGIVSFLDSRILKYIDLVKKNTQFPNYTTNIQEVIEFAQTKILEEETPHQTKIKVQ